MDNEQKELNVTFKNGALERIKSIAKDLSISEDRLEDVLTKAVALVDMAKEGTNITVKKGKDEYLIDLRRL